MNGVESSGTPFAAPPAGPAIDMTPPSGTRHPAPAATPPFEPSVDAIWDATLAGSALTGTPMTGSTACAPSPAVSTPKITTTTTAGEHPRIKPPSKRQQRKAARHRNRVRDTAPPEWMKKPAPVKHPRDWRWFVGGLGRILITLGLMIFAFVAYQLWGTGIQYAQHQNDLKSEFEALLAQAPTPVSAPGAATTVAPVPDPAVVGDPATVATSVGEAPATVAAVVQAAPLPPIELGDPIAFLEIPAIGLDPVAIVAGVRTDDLKKGVGHFPTSPMPGQPGNASLAGHRTTYGQPFIDIDKVQVGDEIIVTTLQGRFVYRMTGQQIVKPSDGQVVANQPDKKMLTLTSCNPKYSAAQRIVVTADLDEAASDPLGAPTVNYLDPAVAAAQPPAPMEPLPGETIDPATTVVDGIAPVETSVVATPDEPLITDPNGEVDPVSGVSESFDESVDALSAGWFSDPDAWPQIALWGSILALVAILAWRLSVKVGRKWVGYVVGFAPFVVVLYFFFENVNRMMPPNL